MARKQNNNHIIKVIATDALGVLCLLLVPVLGPLPGPGGVPLIIAGLGLLAANHDWADSAIDYVKQHSDNFRRVLFPDKTWIKWFWDISTITLFCVSLWINIAYEHIWIIRGMSIGTMAMATTLFMMNRDRIDWLDRAVHRSGKK